MDECPSHCSDVPIESRFTAIGRDLVGHELDRGGCRSHSAGWTIEDAREHHVPTALRDQS